MSWAARRRFLILFILGAIVVAVIAVTLIATLYQAPSCQDNIQNQNEAGIDCGGPCPYLCSDSATAPTILFTKAIPNGTGRTDVLAYVENKNAGAAARSVAYTIALYGADHALVQSVQGTLDLFPGSITPVYVPGITSGNQPVVSAFLTIDPSSISWFSYTETRTLPKYDNDAQLTNAASLPRITASLSNSSAQPLQNVRALVAVRDSSGNVLAASQTVIPRIAGQDKAQVTFTWNQPFTGIPASIEVVPVITLP